MSLLPIFLKLDGRRALLVGAGKVALGKIGTLLSTGLQLRVVAPAALPEIRQLATEGRLEWVERSFEPADLDGNFLVVAATDSPEVNATVHRSAVERNILSNSVDDIPNCVFFFGSVVARGPLQIAISTAGESPAFAQRLRREIDEQLPDDLGPWLENLGELRREVLATHPEGEARKLLLHQLAQRPLCASEDCPSRRLVSTPLEQDQDQTSCDRTTQFIQPSRSAMVSHPCARPGSTAHELGALGWSKKAQGWGTEFMEDKRLRAESTATVHLVGAGPGDPDLLTVKALRLIQAADVLLHDDLVPQAILDLASPTAEIVPVGKRCGVKSISQDEINSLMISHARAGRCVIRLKGGDPMLFGRAAEEIAALTEAGVPFEVVSGITAAFAAAAAIGCSLTDRESASSVLLTTGHHAPGNQRPPLPLMENATRAIYMPGRDLQLLAQDWLRQGLSPDLPCAVVSRAAQPDQQIQRTTLKDLGEAMPALAPSLLLAGWALTRLNAQSLSPQRDVSLVL
jgi:uroporphyrin-III C-methyltransferase / precorrin-2 dehydrogenase / sirohydrochlorin ferrochelatase